MDRGGGRELYERMLLGLWHAEDRTLDERAASPAHDEVIIHQTGERHHGAAALADLVRAGREPFTDVAVRIDTRAGDRRQPARCPLAILGRVRRRDPRCDRRGGCSSRLHRP